MINGGERRKIAEPGEPTCQDLGTVLAIAERPALAEQLRRDLDAVSAAEARAQNVTDGILIR
jgi:hypothetical protein